MPNEDKLNIAATSDREIEMSRGFKAPRSLVFETLTVPALVSRWLLGPPGWSMPVCEIDLRVGGAYRYVWRGGDGTEIGVSGVYREITPPERLVCTEIFDQSWYPGEAIITTILEDKDGETRLRTIMRYESRAARDAVLASPMESGASASYDRLAALLTSPSSSAERRQGGT